MKTDLHRLFPDDISDETAAVLSELLYELAVACETRYLTQIRRYHNGQKNLYDPERPWLSPPAKEK